MYKFIRVGNVPIITLAVHVKAHKHCRRGSRATRTSGVGIDDGAGLPTDLSNFD